MACLLKCLTRIFYVLLISLGVGRDDVGDWHSNLTLATRRFFILELELGHLLNASRGRLRYDPYDNRMIIGSRDDLPLPHYHYRLLLLKSC